ncbi:MAG: GntR family transcriptional regulator [Pseudomonadota bacterium]
MRDTLVIGESKSTADIVFDKLHEEIATLAILPGSKISEADVARRFGVSRQPARDAFRRLHNLGFLEIRPQRATVVRRFSLEEIESTRFIRLAVELEVLERACQVWDQGRADALAQNLDLQANALAKNDIGRFHGFDYAFHRLICELSGLPGAIDMINACKHKVDRLCVLSLSNNENAGVLLDDHRAIAVALADRSVRDVRALLRLHISRLDRTIAEIHQTHASYFQ